MCCCISCYVGVTDFRMYIKAILLFLFPVTDFRMYFKVILFLFPYCVFYILPCTRKKYCIGKTINITVGKIAALCL